MNPSFIEFVNKCICESNPKNLKTNESHSGINGEGKKNQNESSKSRTGSMTDRSNSTSQNTDDDLHQGVKSTSNSVSNETNSMKNENVEDDNLIFSQSDLLKSLLKIPNEDKLGAIVCIKEWNLLKKLEIGDNCGYLTRSLTIFDCPKLKSIKIGKKCFTEHVECVIQCINNNNISDDDK